MAFPMIPDASFDGGDLDCGNGLLILIRQHLGPLERGQLLHLRSTDKSVAEDLPSWSRLTGNDLLEYRTEGTGLETVHHFLVVKGSLSERKVRLEEKIAPKPVLPGVANPIGDRVVPLPPRDQLIPRLPKLAVFGIGSMPRPAWLLRMLHEKLEGRITEEEFENAADDAVRLVVSSQESVGVDVLSDGEQRRDTYSSFVGGRLSCCRLIPVSDLLPYVDDPDKFKAELSQLDVPAEKVHHPALLGPLVRNRPLALQELAFLRTVTNRPIKVALPGPYLLTRTLFLECLSEKVYKEREALAVDVVRLLREEIADLLAHGASFVQIDEPVLTEVVFAQTKKRRSFMCGALSGRLPKDEELEFARTILAQTLEGFPRERLAMHVCRGNWSRDESVALSGDYEPLVELFSQVPVGMLLLEFSTPRAGEMKVLRDLPRETKLGLGLVNPKTMEIESESVILKRVEEAMKLFGADRVAALHPDCGFATFADNPVSSLEVARAKLEVLAGVAKRFR
ncbi:MAG: cobalamin-independent methionine synthase II family protein [Planctomycetota bacterium]|nr:cobalamin-independent methionine synthase II family protein [Planctomycetota bacterium]